MPIFAEVQRIYAQTRSDADALDMPAMFSHIVDYFAASKKFRIVSDMDAVKAAFRFQICNQYDYPNLLK